MATGEDGAHFTPTVVLLPRAALGVALWREESFAPLRGLVVADRRRRRPWRSPTTAPTPSAAAVFGPGEEVVAGLRAARVLVDEGPLYQDAHLVVGGVGDSGLAGRGRRSSRWSGRAACTAPGGLGQRTRRCCQWTKASRPGRPSSQPTPEPRQPA